MPENRPKVDRKAEIRDAAAVLFEAKGFYNTSMEDISEALSIRKPTLYYYVESKGQLVAWIHDGLADLFLAQIESRIDDGWSPSECLKSVVTDTFEVFERKPGHLRVYFENHREIPLGYQEVSKAKRDKFFAIVKGLIEKAIREGSFKDRDPELATLAFFGMCNWGYQWYKGEGKYSPTDVSSEFWEVFARGVER